MNQQYPVGRFAPTPSGRMHLGNVFAAMAAWLSARSRQGSMVLRMEDLDTERTGAGYFDYYLLHNVYEKSIETYLDPRWGILPYFESVLGAEDWSVGPKDERARCFCRENGLCPEETWFIGDLLHDLETARLCGASCLLLPIGHQSTHDLQTAGESFCSSVSEILHRLGIDEVKP